MPHFVKQQSIAVPSDSEDTAIQFLRYQGESLLTCRVVLGGHPDAVWEGRLTPALTTEEKQTLRSLLAKLRAHARVQLGVVEDG